MITYDLNGKTAIVTDSNRGIGKAMADALEAAGAKAIRTSGTILRQPAAAYIHGAIIPLDGDGSSADRHDFH